MDCFSYTFCSCSCHLCPTTLIILIPTNLDIFGFIKIWECSLHYFIVKLVHECLLSICHLRGLRATCLEYKSLLQMIPKWFENCMTLKCIISWTPIVGNLLLDTCYMCGCKSMWDVCNCGTATSIWKLLKKS